MSTAPWLSVLIPIYNVEPFLRECVESVLSQADTGVEVLLLDDCSTDGSAALMRQLGQQDARITCLAHERNGGLSAARNTLLDAARGDYIWFLDSDDFLEPGAVPALRRIVDAHQPDLVLCDYRIQRERPRLKHKLRGELHKRTFPGLGRRLLSDRSVLLHGLFEAGHMHSWSKIAKRSLWGSDLRFPVGRYFEDVATTPLLALRAQNYWHEPGVWVTYRMRAGSILRTPNLDKALHMIQALTEPRAAARQMPLSSAALFAWSHYAARGFIGGARLAARSDTSDRESRMAQYRRTLLEAMPLTPVELQQAYLRRGWLWRTLRLRYWLQRALLADSVRGCGDNPAG